MRPLLDFSETHWFQCYVFRDLFKELCFQIWFFRAGFPHLGFQSIAFNRFSKLAFRAKVFQSFVLRAYIQSWVGAEYTKMCFHRLIFSNLDSELCFQSGQVSFQRLVFIADFSSTRFQSWVVRAKFFALSFELWAFGVEFSELLSRAEIPELTFENRVLKILDMISEAFDFNFVFRPLLSRWSFESEVSKAYFENIASRTNVQSLGFRSMDSKCFQSFACRARVSFQSLVFMTALSTRALRAELSELRFQSWVSRAEFPELSLQSWVSEMDFASRVLRAELSEVSFQSWVFRAE